MSKETAQWYLEIVDAFLKDPRLSQWNYLPRDYFLAHLKEIFKEIQEIETFAQAREILQKIINEEILAPSIPEKDSLEYWQQELEKAKVERRKIKEESIRLVQVQVKRWEETSLLAKAIQAEEAKKVPLETEEEKLAKNEASLAQKIQNELENQDKSLTSDPDLSQALAEEVKEIIVSEILFDPDKGIENLSLQIDRKLQERGVILGQKKGRVFVGNISTAAQPEILKIKEIGEKPLPDEVLIQLSEKTEGVAFTPVYAILQPKVAAAYIEKAIFTPAAKFLKKAEITSPEWKEIVEKGIFAENIQETINTLKEAGLSETHPTIRKLEAKLQKVSKIQKDEKGKDKPGARVFKHYYHFDELTGKPLYDKETKIFLSRKPIWSGGYSLRLREAFNKIGSVLRLYERIPLGPGKTVFHFSLSPKISKFLTFGRYELGAIRATVYRQTIGKAVLALGKTAVGKVVKEGIKKAATWILTKLGLAVLPEPVSKVLLIASLVWDAIKLGWGLLKRGLRRLSDKPIETIILGAILGTIGFFIFAPLPLKLLLLGAGLFLGALGFIGGLAKWAGGIISGIGSFFSGTFSTIGGFISSLTTISLPSSLPALAVGGAIGATTGLTILTLSAVSTAFMLPGREEIIGSPYIDVVKNAMPKTQYANDELPKTVTYTIIVMAKQAKLINVKINDQTTVTKDGPVPIVPSHSWDVPEISGTWSQTYDLELTRPDFEDSLVTNVVTVTADVEGGPAGQTASTSLTIIIGSPPEDCPSGWPTPYGYITQGPDADCNDCSHQNDEAIDIGVNGIINTPAYATHHGIATFGLDDPGAGNWVQISGICQGKTIITQYFHLETISVRNNQEVHRRIQVGGVGETGCPGCGIHLHYEFAQNLPMEPPYIPVRVPRGCGSYNECGKIEW